MMAWHAELVWLADELLDWLPGWSGRRPVRMSSIHARHGWAMIGIPSQAGQVTLFHAPALLDMSLHVDQGQIAVTSLSSPYAQYVPGYRRITASLEMEDVTQLRGPDFAQVLRELARTWQPDQDLPPAGDGWQVVRRSGM